VHGTVSKRTRAIMKLGVSCCKKKRPCRAEEADSTGVFATPLAPPRRDLSTVLYNVAYFMDKSKCVCPE
jgi:hypothetical protein